LSTPRSRQGQAAQGRAGRARRPRPLPRGDTLFTPDASATRASVEQRSATPLLWLHQLPRWLLPVLAVALLVTGFALTGWAGAIALVALAAALGWLAVVSWPRLNAQGRALRVLVIAVVLLVAVVRGLHG
jgi:O-antigen ligase